MSIGPVTFSAVEGQEFGSFHYHLGLIHHSFGKEEAAVVRAALNRDPQQRDFIEPTKDNVATAFRVASVFHETRHLIDGFGTLAGISLFSNTMSLLKDLCHWATIFGSKGFAWQLPLRDWVMAPECPQGMRDFVRRLRAFHQAEPYFLALFTPFTAEGHCEDMLVDVQSTDGRVLKAFPLRMAKGFSDDLENLEMVSLLYPLGFEAMVEGSAHAVCRNLVSYLFPKEIADELILSVRFRELRNDAELKESDLLSSTPPYMITDLMISRFLRSRGIAQFPRDTVLGLTDLVLSQCSISLVEPAKGLTGVKFDDFGQVLLHTLENQPLKELAEGRVVPPDSIDLGYRSFLGELEKGGDWDTVEDDSSPLSSIRIWESYCAQNLTVPLLRRRIETDHAAFRTNDGFLELAPVIQQAALRTRDGKLQNSLPNRVMQAWAHVMMLSALARQIATDQTTLVCPRRHRSIPGITSLNFAQRGHCEAHAEFGCGAFQRGVFAYQPACLFEGAIRLLNLSRD